METLAALAALWRNFMRIAPPLPSQVKLPLAT